MADTQKGPFDRVANGYDPRQVAAFAAEALTWKRELRACRKELEAVRSALEYCESLVGSIEDAEDRADAIVRKAEDEAARILETATDRDDPEMTAPESDIGEGGSERLPQIDDHHDPVEKMFGALIEGDASDREALREERIAAAAANLWKRRGVLAPPE